MCGYFYPSASGVVASAVVKQLYVRRMMKLKMIKNERIDRVELMRTFVRIVEAGSLSAAAKQMGTTQATVSRRLQSLETLLGVKLIMALEDGLNVTEDEPVGTLRVRAPHAFGQQQLLEPLLQFLSRYPQVAVEWMLNDKTVDFLSDNIDCAIRVGAEVDPATVAVLLAEVPRSMVASPGLLEQYGELSHPEQLSALPWIAVNTFYQHSVSLLHQLRNEPVTLNISPRLSTDSIYVARSAALAGLGVTIVSSWMVAEDIANGRLVALLPEWHAAPLPVHLVYPWARYYPIRLRKFLALMKDVMPQLTGMKGVDQI